MSSNVSRRPGRTWIPFVALALGLAMSPPADAYLSYTLSSELKKSSCTGDIDADCLDNAEENNLAWAAAPWYFYDEDEGCSEWRNELGAASFHFARQDFIQVRPEGGGIGTWSPTDGKTKWVRVSYFFLFPHDCGAKAGFLGGHQGDSEHIKLLFYSYDLRTWYLYNAYYAHHDMDHYFTGEYLESRANALGTRWVSVASDEDSHGSWPGWQADSTHCAGAEDDIGFGTFDCFRGTWRSDLNNGYGFVPSTSRNIGGPSPETWNASVVTMSGVDAYTQMDVGHGLNREYWSQSTDSRFQKFCGWECSTASRNADGTCAASAHDQTGCSSRLTNTSEPEKSKTDLTLFSVQGGSCAGRCGGPSTDCYCDASCVTYGDCCVDACSLCGVC